MTFDKYKQGREKFNDTVFPDDGYDYDYIFNKEIGWYQVRGKKLSDLPKQEWDIKILKEVKE
jgi:hypothetical protein